VIIKEIPRGRYVEERTYRCWTKFKTDVPMAVDSFLGRSLLTWRFENFQNLIGISLKSKTKVINHRITESQNHRITE